MNADHPFVYDQELSIVSHAGRHLTFIVKQVFEPFTQSQVLVAECSALPTPKVVLKIFDPRYINDRFNRMCNNEIDRPWTLEAEAASVANPVPIYWGDDKWGPEELEIEPTADDGEDAIALRAARWERHFQERAQRSFDKELTAYQRLEELQGYVLPRLYDHGEYRPAGDRFIQPRVLVLEYIDGITVDDAPASTLATPIAGQLYNALARLGPLGVIHNDVNWGNIMLSPASSPHRVVLIDFGRAFLRQDDHADEFWYEQVNMHAEETATMSLLMTKRIEWQPGLGVPQYRLPPPPRPRSERKS